MTQGGLAKPVFRLLSLREHTHCPWRVPQWEVPKLPFSACCGLRASYESCSQAQPAAY